MEEFKRLNQNEIELLLRAPALVSVLAASIGGEVDEKEKADAIKLSHLRTFTTKGALSEYYKKVEEGFEKEFERLNRELPKNLSEREKAVSKQLKKLDPILEKLDDKFAKALKHSLDTYKDHVSKAHRNALELFVLPMNFTGLTD